LPPGSSEVLAAENVTLDVEKHERQRLNASIVKEDCVPREEKTTNNWSLLFPTGRSRFIFT
jgi:hypothetical protein